MLAKGLFEGKTELSGAWNFGPNDESFMPVEALVKNAINILGKGAVEIKPDSSKHEANILKLDINKARTTLNWKPRLNFQENLNFTFDWYKNYYENLSDSVEFTKKQIKEFFEE
jgi:CDP-glucose 4,6-dehydratase